MASAADVVIDTSVLLMPFTDGLDLHGQLERVLGAVVPVMAASVHEELHHLAASDGARARAAKGALALTRNWRIEATDLPGDDGVLDVARRLQAAVATNDRNLAGQARASGLAVLMPRGHGLAQV